jgi:hypothetical protein
VTQPLRQRQLASLGGISGLPGHSFMRRGHLTRSYQALWFVAAQWVFLAKVPYLDTAMAEDYRYQHYKVLRREDGSLWELGRGAIGITYKAFDTNLRCPVALKVINNSNLNSELARQRFLREAQAAATLRHQNVASLFHIGTDDHGNYFCAMEFIDGETVDLQFGHFENVSRRIKFKIFR